VFVPLASMKLWLLTIVVGAALACGVSGGVRSHPYGFIAERNPFRLRPMPEPVVPITETNPPAPPRPDVKITGITTLLGEPVVTLQYEDKEQKKVKFSPLLSAGKEYEKLVVERIDVQHQTAVVRIDDMVMTLDFVRHGVKPSVAAAPAPAVPAPGRLVPPAPPRLPTTINTGPAIVSGPNAGPNAAPMPTVSAPAWTPEQARAYMEIIRRKQEAEAAIRQGGAVTLPARHSLTR